MHRPNFTGGCWVQRPGDLIEWAWISIEGHFSRCGCDINNQVKHAAVFKASHPVEGRPVRLPPWFFHELRRRVTSDSQRPLTAPATDPFYGTDWDQGMSDLYHDRDTVPIKKGVAQGYLYRDTYKVTRTFIAQTLMAARSRRAAAPRTGDFHTLHAWLAPSQKPHAWR